MSRTLNLIDILLNTGANLTLVGRFTEALEPLTRLAEFRKLPEPVLEELHSLRADIHFQLKNFTEARRHLTAAIALRPLEARNHYLMALAIEQDDTADRKRAQMYYERAIQIEPDNATYWADFGSYLFTLDKIKEAVKAIRKAYALNDADVENVARVAEVLRREGYFAEATTKVARRLFRQSRLGCVQTTVAAASIRAIHAQQQQKNSAKKGDSKPVILPFTPAPTQGKYLDLGGKTIRIDQAEPIAGPKEQTPAPYRRPPKG